MWHPSFPGFSGLPLPIVIIAEKADMGRKVARALLANPPAESADSIRCGDLSICWASGHLLEIPEPEDPEWSWATVASLLPQQGSTHFTRWMPTLAKEPRLRRLAESIRSAVSTAGTVIHAGDPDRAGQNIVDGILGYLGWKGPVKRVWMLDLSESGDGLRRSFSNLEDNAVRVRMGRADRARSIVDWWTGIPGTRSINIRSRELGGGKLGAIGRVMSPTLAILVNNEMARRNFKPQTFYVPVVDAEGTACRWQSPKPLSDKSGGTRPPWPGAMTDFPGTDPDGLLVDKAAAERFLEALKSARWTSRFTETAKSAPPPLPLSNARLQVEGIKRGVRASDLAEAAQKLYELGAQSYYRSDAEYIPEGMFADAPMVIDAVRSWLPDLVSKPGFDISRKSRAFSDKALTGKDGVVSPHYAIIPTSGSRATTEIQNKVATIVAQFYVAQFYPDRRWTSQNLTLEAVIAQGEFAGTHQFVARGMTVVDPGWSVVLDAADDEGRALDPRLKSLPSGWTPTSSSLDEGRTKPPPPMTKGGLQMAMMSVHKYEQDPATRAILRESEGIGTSATRGPTVDKLVKSGLVAVDSKDIVTPTPMGISNFTALPPALKSPGTTALWERGLRQIESGQLDETAFLSKMLDSFIHPLISGLRTATWETGRKPMEGMGKPCPKCGQGHLKVFESAKHGNKRFLACDAGKDKCDHMEFPESEGWVRREEVAPLPGHGDTCPKCHAGTMKTWGKNGRRFLSCDAGKGKCDHAVFPESEGWAKREEVAPLPGHGDACPKCRKGKMTTRGTKDGKRFLSCDAGKGKCDHAVFPESEGWARREEVAPLPGHGDACPKCRKGKMLTRSKDGKRFLSCSAGRDKCRNAVFPESEGWTKRTA